MNVREKKWNLFFPPSDPLRPVGMWSSEAVFCGEEGEKKERPLWHLPGKTFVIEEQCGGHQFKDGYLTSGSPEQDCLSDSTPFSPQPTTTVFDICLLFRKKLGHGFDSSELSEIDNALQRQLQIYLCN